MPVGSVDLDLLLDAPAGDRETILRRECGDDQALRAEVVRLLDASSSDLPAESAPALAADLVDAALRDHDTKWAGKRIGAYVIRELLGVPINSALVSVVLSNQSCQSTSWLSRT